MRTFAELTELALKIIADPDLVGKQWHEVIEAQGLDPDDDADGNDFCSVMHSNWIYSNLADLILKGDYDALAAFIERADPKGTVRQGIK